MKNGEQVAAFEREFAEYVGAKYAIALCNGTATLHTALVALGVKPGDKVAVPPLTMSATTIAVLQAGAIPVFRDVDPMTWLMADSTGVEWAIPVSLYGLHVQPGASDGGIDDAAQTLRPHGWSDFTSYSFQASKILSLGEGGMLVTNDEELATRARSFSSLGYKLDPKSPRIDPAILKSPDYERHHWPLAFNYRMADRVASAGYAALTNEAEVELTELKGAYLHMPSEVEAAKYVRREAASFYRKAISESDLVTPQYVPQGCQHDYWCYTVAAQTKELASQLSDAIVKHGGERPYGAWRLTYQEPAFRHLGGRRWPDGAGRPLPEGVGLCPIAENLQPRLLQFQTNNLASAEKNAHALSRAIREINGQPEPYSSRMLVGTIGCPCS